ncbi:MAG: serine hydrolase [Phormidesmis priestleyi]|uniref:Serine hydrolase n=1 Tax=Phormidesmis priestleyi TaxID=268141 RepID=A0A2W4YTY5_9CYAN|nr:MAG: serine hydrolase [Phormidesmis priestleyi]
MTTLTVNSKTFNSTTDPLLPTPALAKPISKRIARIDTYLNALFQAGEFSGSVAIACDKADIITRSYGLSNREHEVLNTPQTRFRIGSLTKQFTAVSILQLQEKGLLNVHSPISNYLPSYPRCENITVHHLLSHTSGIPEYLDPGAFSDFFEWMQLPTTLGHLVDRFKDLPLEFVPGEKFKYGNSGYALLAQIIESLTQQPYADYLQVNVLDPLALRNTGQEIPLAVITHLAQGYVPIQGDVYLQASPFDLSIAQGAGGLYSTVADLVKWNQWLCGKDADRRVLGQAARAMMLTPVVQIDIAETPDAFYCYGVALDTYLERSRIHHLGGISGFASALAYYPKEKLTIAVLSNFEAATVQSIGEELATIMFEPFPTTQPDVSKNN